MPCVFIATALNEPVVQEVLMIPPQLEVQSAKINTMTVTVLFFFCLLFSIRTDDSIAIEIFFKLPLCLPGGTDQVPGALV
jgi:hypothetical protein